MFELIFIEKLVYVPLGDEEIHDVFPKVFSVFWVVVEGDVCTLVVDDVEGGVWWIVVLVEVVDDFNLALSQTDHLLIHN